MQQQQNKRHKTLCSWQIKRTFHHGLVDGLQLFLLEKMLVYFVNAKQLQLTIDDGDEEDDVDDSTDKHHTNGMIANSQTKQQYSIVHFFVNHKS